MVSRKSESRPRIIRTQVQEVVLHLRQIQSAIVVAVAALRQQNSDLDEDIANVLQRSVADRIQDQIERLEAVTRLLASLGRGARPAA
ncbi:MAG TPA: hypothetical protein VFB37_08105 [Steroidobacteraceae bacterium]|nr:hypothetical protein [Steroidobacteraceae bacterium]